MTRTARAAEVAIEVWLPHHRSDPLSGDGIWKLAASFHELHPEYVINIREGDSGTGRTPTLVQYPHSATQQARDMRSESGGPLFVPVHDAIDGRQEILGHPVVTRDILAAARAAYSYDGVLLAVPTLISTTLLYANTRLLEAAGVTRLPQTWNEVEGACEAVRGVPGVRHAIAWPNHGEIFQQAVAQAGGLLADHGNGRRGRAEKMLLDSPEMLAFVGWWRRMHRQGRYLYARQDWEDTFTAFAEQEVAFILGSSAEADRLSLAGREHGFEVAAGRMPYSGRFPFAGNSVGGDAIWLTDGVAPAVRDGALAFLQYLMAPEHAAQRRTPPAVALDQLAASDRSPAALGALIGEADRIQDTMARAMHDVLLGEEDPAWRFAAANVEAQRLLDEYNERCRAHRA